MIAGAEVPADAGADPRLSEGHHFLELMAQAGKRSHRSSQAVAGHPHRTVIGKIIFNKTPQLLELAEKAFVYPNAIKETIETDLYDRQVCETVVGHKFCHRLVYLNPGPREQFQDLGQTLDRLILGGLRSAERYDSEPIPQCQERLGTILVVVVAGMRSESSNNNGVQILALRIRILTIQVRGVRQAGKSGVPIFIPQSLELGPVANAFEDRELLGVKDSFKGLVHVAPPLA